SVSPYCLIFAADSCVSFSHRPELAAISEPACAAAEPVRRADPNDGNSIAIDERPPDVRNRWTAAGFAMTATPSPSLISSISSLLTGSISSSITAAPEVDVVVEEQAT